MRKYPCCALPKGAASNFLAIDHQQRKEPSHPPYVTSPEPFEEMVQLQEVEDEELNAQQPGPKEDEDEWDTDTGAHPRFSSKSIIMLIIG